MSSIVTRLRTYGALGLGNVARVGLYRLGLKTGRHPVLRVTGETIGGPFFAPAKDPLPFAPREDWQESGAWFGRHEVALDGPPDWHLNPLKDARWPSDKAWHELPDFDPALGDIKAVWEASRFDWVIAMATRAAAGDARELDRLNDWIEHWLERNPPYSGVNWKCGQEASIRVLHLCLAAKLLGQAGAPSKPLRNLVKLHLQRIAPTMGYAVGQANNHATSEAAALYCGGLLLGEEGASYRRTGESWLGRLATRLILEDGTFSQYSLVYHRVMLDTYCFAECWRRHFNAPPFPDDAYDRLARASEWLAYMVDPATGDGPNFGANDGARILALTDGPYRDFRPTLQSAAALFLDRRALDEDGPWDRLLLAFGLKVPDTPLALPPHRSFLKGGLHVLRVGDAKALLRFGRFAFRPSQADLMHVDLWVDGENILRDDGTYGYADGGVQLGGAATHNSLQFGNSEPMPRLSRFLWGDWVEADSGPVIETQDGASVTARHRDANGNVHERTITLTRDRLICEDVADGAGENAVLRWRLRPGDWSIDGNSVRDGRVTVSVEGDAISEGIMETGEESRFYLDRQAIPVMKVTCSLPARIRTEIRF